MRPVEFWPPGIVASSSRLGPSFRGGASQQGIGELSAVCQLSRCRRRPCGTVSRCEQRVAAWTDDLPRYGSVARSGMRQGALGR